MIEDWMKEIQKVARKASFDWPGIVEQDDLVQDVVVHILESPGTQRDLAEMDDNARYRTLHKIAQRIASQERTDYEYFSGNFRYSVNEVRKLLENGILTESAVDLQSAWSAEEFISTGTSYEDKTFLMVSVESDLKDALATMEKDSRPYYDIIVRRYRDREAGITQTGAGHTKLSRALASLTAKMNHGHKAPPGRTTADPDARRPVDDWGKYSDWAEAREEYEDSLSEIHEPKPELVSVGPDGLGTFNITRSRP